MHASCAEDTESYKLSAAIKQLNQRPGNTTFFFCSYAVGYSAESKPAYYMLWANPAGKDTATCVIKAHFETLIAYLSNYIGMDKILQKMPTGS